MKHVEEARIALWADAAELCPALLQKLQRLGCRVERVDSLDDLWNLMERDLDLVVANCQSATDLLHWMRGVRLASSTPPPVLMLADARDVNVYLKAMTLGAFDCVAVPIRDEELQRLVQRAVETPRAEPLMLHA